MATVTDNTYRNAGLFQFASLGFNSTFTNLVVSSLQAPAIPFSDNFTRANGTSLGDTWQTGLVGGDFGINSNQAQSLGIGTNVASLYGVNFTSSTTVSANVTNVGTGLGAGAGQLEQRDARWLCVATEWVDAAIVQDDGGVVVDAEHGPQRGQRRARSA